MLDELVKLIVDLKEQEALDLTKKYLEQGIDTMDILGDAKKSMGIVGDKFASGEYFIPDLVFSGEILKGITEIVQPYLKKDIEVERLGKVIIGTVAGDIHDIGKNLVTFMLDVSGFEVYDLGIDVPAKKFIDTINGTGASVVGLSGFLTLAFDSMKNTIDMIKEAGLRESVKVMIGGGQIDDEIKSFTGTDAYGKDAMEAVKIAKEWIGG